MKMSLAGRCVRAVQLTLLLAFALLPRAVAAKSPPWKPLNLSARLEQLLAKGTYSGTPGGFRIIALSHLADGCANLAAADPELRAPAAACVRRGFELARKLQPTQGAVHQVGHGLWLSHLNLILGAGDRVGGCLDEALHRRVTEALAARTRASPTLHIASYPKRPERWPADQAATLASIARFDAGHGTEIHATLASAWWKWLRENALDAAAGLPWSEVTGKGPGARHPRGSAQAFLVRYAAEFSPEEAARSFDLFRKAHLEDLSLLVGFREWPRGVDRKADLDSGPIFKGIGTAASAFGIAAARAVGDEHLASRLEASARAAESLPGMGAAASSTLAEAIRLVGATQRPTRRPRGE